MSVSDNYWVDKMFVQMIDKFDSALIARSTNGDVIENRKMLNILTQPDSARVRTNRHTEFRRHQQNRDDFVDARQTTAVQLTKTDGICLKELFEHYTVLTMFAGRHADRRKGAGDCGVTENIVGT